MSMTKQSRARQSRSRVLLLTAALIAAGCASPGAEEPGGADDAGIDSDGEVFTDKSLATRPLEDIVASTFVLKNFEAALVASRVMPEMRSPPYTFFAPWNTAFEALPYWQKITRDRGWYGHLRELVRGHIHQGNLSTAALKSSKTATMLNGDTANISNASARLRVDGANVIGSTAAKDGHAHVLDEVRAPKWARRTILDIVNSDARFRVLARVLSHPSMSAKRTELASSTVGLTLFALRGALRL